MIVLVTYIFLGMPFCNDDSALKAHFHFSVGDFIIRPNWKWLLHEVTQLQTEGHVQKRIKTGEPAFLLILLSNTVCCKVKQLNIAVFFFWCVFFLMTNAYQIQASIINHWDKYRWFSQLYTVLHQLVSLLFFFLLRWNVSDCFVWMVNWIFNN